MNYGPMTQAYKWPAFGGRAEGGVQQLGLISCTHLTYTDSVFLAYKV